MRFRVFVVSLVSGCAFQGRALPPADDAAVDAVADAATGDGDVGPDACLQWTFLPAEFDPCALPAPAAPFALGTGTYVLDSDTGILSGPSVAVALPYLLVNGVGVVSVSSLNIPTGAVIRGTGSIPLVIASWTSITLDGTLDVSSSIAGGAGAGATATVCPIGGAPVRSGPGDGGGAGASFKTAGGGGGTGGIGAGLGGVAGATRALPSIVEGGCRGGDADGADGTPGIGGHGGGALALIAKDSLTVAGLVHGSGAGGTGGSVEDTGGGGGGSGGMIKLETANLIIASSAHLTSNGGQGGGGCEAGTAGAGVDGRADEVEAIVANHEAGGTDGGSGGHRARPDGAAASNTVARGGGGGGGGGGGWIVYKAYASAVINPSALISPSGDSF